MVEKKRYSYENLLHFFHVNNEQVSLNKGSADRLKKPLLIIHQSNKHLDWKVFFDREVITFKQLALFRFFWYQNQALMRHNPVRLSVLKECCIF